MDEIQEGYNACMKIHPIEDRAKCLFDLSQRILRSAISAENEAIDMYERWQTILESYDRLVKNSTMRKLFDEVIDDEKEHVAKFMAMLLKIDEKQHEEMKKYI